MFWFLLIPTVACGAFCVWLTIRFVNRRERWAKWTGVSTVLAVPVLYVASFGPVCALTPPNTDDMRTTGIFYAPLVLAADRGPESLQTALMDYAEFCGSEMSFFMICCYATGN